MVVGSLFSGVGMLDYGLTLAGHEHAWLCEVDPFRRVVLGRRWPSARVFDDIRAVGAAAAERVDFIVGGFPCKGASTTGKRNGFDHPETRLWREMARAIGELRPGYVVVENVANIIGLLNGSVWGTVLGDLAALGYDVQWDCIPAAAFGAPHLRDRVIAVATDTTRESEVRQLDVEGQPAGWPHIGRGDLPAVADPSGEHRQAGTAAREALGRTQGRGDAASAHTDGDGVRVQPEPECRRGRSPVAAEPDEVAAHAARDAEGGAGAAPWAERQRARARTGISVEWGVYEPAIRRWEAVHGPAPKPLLRRVDDRAAARVERSRLSALGDGVQVQLGELVGRYLMSLEESN
jgi:site-specific DNA-cytosine methylase